ncbi:MAG TPA: DUF1579 family protein [Gemmataceae bacterium]|nr:DUF1579 family protein [Gemmataceae bacterium]
MSTRLLWVAVLLLTMGAGSSPGQAPTVPAAQREAMKQLDFLVGQWKGEGWTEFAPGQRRPFKGTEVVQRKLDGLLLTIEGLHRGQIGGRGKEVVVHNAFALLSYDAKAKRYRFQAFTSRGNYEEAEARVTKEKLVWGMKVPQLGDVRYTIKLDDKGRWFEIGEMSQDGKKWQQFFEMTLQRVDAK